MAWGEEEKDKVRILSHERLLFEHEKGRKEAALWNWGLFAVSLIVGVLISMLMVYNISDFFVDFSKFPIVFLLQLILIIIGWACVWWPFACSVMEIVDDWRLHVKIRDRKYTVVDDVVIASSSGEIHPTSFWRKLRGHGRRYEPERYATLYFSKSGRQPVGRGMYEHCPRGARCYVVLLDGKEPKVYCIYHQDFYRWEGEPAPYRAEP